VRLVRRLLDHPATGFIVLGIGVLSLALVPLVHYYVLPRVELTPFDSNATSVSSGQGTYFDQNSVSIKGPVTLTVTTRVVGDVAAGQASGDAVWNVSTTVDTPFSLKLHDPRFSLDWTLERWVVNRSTNLPVRCCGEHPDFGGNVYLKFPFGVTKGVYQFWNPKAKHAFPVHFTGVQNVGGHELYRFEGPVPATKIGSVQVPGALVGQPDAPGLIQVDEYYSDSDSQILVDPMSGIPVGGTQHPKTTFRLPGSSEDRLTVLSATFTSQPASERTVLDLVTDTDKKLQLVQHTLPTDALYGGSFFVLLGAGLLVWSGRRSRKASS
jgi:hypothetical protein